MCYYIVCNSHFFSIPAAIQFHASDSLISISSVFLYVSANSDKILTGSVREHGILNSKMLM